MGASNITLATTITKGADASVARGLSGVAILAGQAVYLDSTTNRWLLAQGDTLIKAAAGGFALNSCPAAGQPLEVVVDGTINGITGLTIGEVYVVSDNLAGAVMFNDDIGAADYVTIMGVAELTTRLKVKVFPSGVAHS